MKVNNLGRKGQERMIANGWRLIVAESCRETPEELKARCEKMGFKQVKVYWAGTRIKGIHDIFAMVKREAIKSEEKENEKMAKNMKEKQLANNIEYVLCGYENGMNDCGIEEYPPMTKQEAIDYAKYEIFDMKDDGCGHTMYADGICDDLKFLGNEYIESEILRIADECGILTDEDETQEENTESEKTDNLYEQMCANCFKEKYCHEHCTHCDEYLAKAELAEKDWYVTAYKDGKVNRTRPVKWADIITTGQRWCNKFWDVDDAPINDEETIRKELAEQGCSLLLITGKVGEIKSVWIEDEIAHRSHGCMYQYEVELHVNGEIIRCNNNENGEAYDEEMANKVAKEYVEINKRIRVNGKRFFTAIYVVTREHGRIINAVEYDENTMFCPRCGKPMGEHTALSRYVDAEICSSCGFAEALADAGMGENIGINEWYVPQV